jgi:hypothetical protein
MFQHSTDRKWRNMGGGLALEEGVTLVENRQGGGVGLEAQ